MRAGKILALSTSAALVALTLSACEGLFVKDPGERLWRKQCAECHGLDAAGNTPRFMGNAYADLTDSTWRVAGPDRGSLEAVVREGVFGQMPAYDHLSREEMRALLDHLAALRGESY